MKLIGEEGFLHEISHEEEEAVTISLKADQSCEDTSVGGGGGGVEVEVNHTKNKQTTNKQTNKNQSFLSLSV